MKQHKFEIILGRIFLVLLLSGLTFVICDRISTKFISSRSSFEQLYLPVKVTRHPKPYVMFGGTPNVGDFNALGYRGKQPRVPKPADEYRVFILGGSTVWSGNPPIAVWLEQTFKKNGYPRVQVYNLGVESSVSGQELARVVFDVPELQPDLVILYNGGNDISAPLVYDPRPGYPFNFLVYERNPLLESDVRFYPALTMLAYGSNILRCLMPSFFERQFVNLKQARKDAGYLTKEWADAIVNQYVHNMLKAAVLAKAFKAETVVFFQPLVYFKQPVTSAESVFNPKGRQAYILEMHQQILGKMAPYAASGFKFYDLSRIFNGHSETIFRDDIHILDAAGEIVAQAIYERLITAVNIPR